MADDSRGGTTGKGARGRMVRAPQDFAAGLVLVALALFALWAGAGLEAGRLRAMGPGMMPRAVAVLLGIAGAALVALSCLRSGEPLQRWSLRGPLFVTLGVLAFAVSIRTAGLAVAGPLVILVGGAASPDARVKELAIFAVALTLLCVVLFRYLLHLPIPILRVPGVVTL